MMVSRFGIESQTVKPSTTWAVWPDSLGTHSEQRLSALGISVQADVRYLLEASLSGTSEANESGSQNRTLGHDNVPDLSSTVCGEEISLMNPASAANGVRNCIH
jgi:hypothetical protein